jgi:CheY-like chemotaxis protein
MKKTILLVDDDLAVLESLTRVLTGEGYCVVPAHHGQEALDVMAVAEVDLVLLDLNMPVRSGWDTFERLSQEHPLLPVVIVTARPNQLFLARAAGVGALLEKPLDIPELLQTIRDLLDEPAEVRLARLAGKETPFHFSPNKNRPLEPGEAEAALATPRWTQVCRRADASDEDLLY